MSSKTDFTGVGEKCEHQKKSAVKREKKFAKDLGGTAVKGSGSFHHCGDIALERFLVQDKFTSKKSFRITTALLEQTALDAARYGKSPALIITFGKINFPAEESWVAIPYSLFKEVFGE